ncbi:unnamed protein product [Rotaria socialis]
MNTTIDYSLINIIFGYYALALVIIGTLLNLFTFFILCHPTFGNAKRRPTLHYMRAMAVFDIAMLYGWNLDHYLLPVHGFKLHCYSVAWCKFTGFLNYFAGQASAWLRVFVCLDRYLALNHLHRTWFSDSKNVLIVISTSLGIIALINLHFFVFSCFINSDGGVNVNAKLYQIYPLWDYVHLVLYNCIPFIIMTTFNGFVIYQLIHLRQTTSIHSSAIRHRAMSITLVLTTFLFCVATIPVTVVFAFYAYQTPYLLHQILDAILYTYHVSCFPIYFTTMNDFRRVTISVVKCQCFFTSVVPLSDTRMTTKI